MSAKNWRNAVIALVLLAALVFVVEYILNIFLASSAVPDFGIQEVKDDLISIFRIVIVFCLAVAVILVPVWIYKSLRERGSGGSKRGKDDFKPLKKVKRERQRKQNQKEAPDEE